MRSASTGGRLTASYAACYKPQTAALATRRQELQNGLGSESSRRHRRSRIRRRVHPDLPASPERGDVRDLPARPEELDACGDRFGVKTRYTDYEGMLRDPNIDAVHINSPIADHAPQSIAALKAGKHVASTVPAATTIDECRQIVELQRRSGKVYMMMETVVYSREYLFVKELYDHGELGRDPVSARQPPAGHGRVAGVLGRLSADALRDALREPVPGAPRQTCRARRLPRVWAHRRGADPEVRQPVRDRDRDLQAARLRRRAPR